MENGVRHCEKLIQAQCVEQRQEDFLKKERLGLIGEN